MARDIEKYRPECPFCGRAVGKPEVTRTDFGEVHAGRCECGTVYVCDPTGHNVGEALSEVLALAKGDWSVGDLAGEDYEYSEMDYDLKSHTRIYGKGIVAHSGKLLFVKMGARPETAAGEGGGKASTESAVLDDPAFSKMRLKDQVRTLLEKDLCPVVGQLALRDKNVLKWLISYSYDKQDILAWRAMEAMGYVAAALRPVRLDVLRETVRRLLWSMTDESGAIGWSSPEHLGEIVRSDPDEFQDLVPVIWSFRDEDTLRSGVAWAMYRIASIRPKQITFVLNDIEELLGDASPAVRGYAALLLKALAPVAETRPLLERLRADPGRLFVYEKGGLVNHSVGDLAG